MSRSFVQVQAALDTKLLTVSGIVGTGATANFEAENTLLQDKDKKTLWVRSTMQNDISEVAAIGGQVIRDGGLYIVDILSKVGTGSTPSKTLADNIIAAIPAGTILTLTNGGQITITNVSPSNAFAMGGNKVGQWYCVQVYIEWEAFLSP